MPGTEANIRRLLGAQEEKGPQEAKEEGRGAWAGRPPGVAQPRDRAGHRGRGTWAKVPEASGIWELEL